MTEWPSLVPLLANCLKNQFQYEVLGTDLVRGYYAVSGVSVLALLQPILGIYQTQGRQASHIRLLHAIPVESAMDSAALNQIIEKTIAWEDLSTRTEEPMPRDVIRGSLGREVVDFVSGARLTTNHENWTRPEVNQEKVRKWWLQCMPIPVELRSMEISVGSSELETGGEG